MGLHYSNIRHIIDLKWSNNRVTNNKVNKARNDCLMKATYPRGKKKLMNPNTNCCRCRES